MFLYLNKSKTSHWDAEMQKSIKQYRKATLRILVCSAAWNCLRSRCSLLTLRSSIRFHVLNSVWQNFIEVSVALLIPICLLCVWPFSAGLRLQLPWLWTFTRWIEIFAFFKAYCACRGYVVAQLVEALLYKPEGRGLDFRWVHWNFSLI